MRGLGATEKRRNRRELEHVDTHMTKTADVLILRDGDVQPDSVSAEASGKTLAGAVRGTLQLCLGTCWLTMLNNDLPFFWTDTCSAVARQIGPLYFR